MEAIKSAYPRFKPELHKSKAKFRNVDKIKSPNKLQLKLIPEYNNEYDKRKYLPKLEVSESIAPFLNIESNTSGSFAYTIRAIKSLVEKKESADNNG